MVLARRRWGMTAGLLLATTTGMPATAQDYGKAWPSTPTHLPAVEALGTEGIAPPASPQAAMPNPNPECVPSWGAAGVERGPGHGSAGAGAGQEWGSLHARYEVPPLGTFLYAHNRTQVANGEAARMMLYDYDFVAGTYRLSPRGQQQLAKIAALLPVNFFPVVIEQTAAGPELDEARRQVVVEELQRGPFPVPAERVVLGYPLNRGLRGVEAELIHQNLLLQVQNRGAPAGLGSSISFPSGPTGTGTSGAGTIPVPLR